MKHLLFWHLLILTLFSCQNKSSVDHLFFNGRIYTVDKDSTVAEAMVVNEGKIVAVGDKQYLLKAYKTKNKTDLKGKTIFPGFIDAHCHFYGYGMNLSQIDLVGTKSWEEVLDSVSAYNSINNDGWVMGRGWDQNDWDVKNFPDKSELDSLFPEKPVYLKRIDGHACVVNQKALDLAGIDQYTKISGGDVILVDGKPSGLLLDNAMDSVEKLIPKPSVEAVTDALLKAQRRCFAVGLTTVSDAGLEKSVIDIINALQKDDELKIRVYAMLTDNEENKNFYFKNGPYKTDRLNVRAFKYYADGALGSRGALLLAPYSDARNTRGLQLKPTIYFEQEAKLCYDHGFQMCTHAIGDSANRMILQVYGAQLGGPNDRRWRIEHCQVIAPDDFDLFHQFTIVPSVQPAHATSDMYWATDRLGIYRIRGAYAYEDLLKENGWIADGSDFPVEDINPIFGFYAAVARKDRKGYPVDGFDLRNALTREQALRAMTIWAAFANFEENEKGSLEAGKFADFVVLDKDIMTIPIMETFKAKVMATYVNGEKVF